MKKSCSGHAYTEEELKLREKVVDTFLKKFVITHPRATREQCYEIFDQAFDPDNLPQD